MRTAVSHIPVCAVKNFIPLLLILFISFSPRAVSKGPLVTIQIRQAISTLLYRCVPTNRGLLLASKISNSQTRQLPQLVCASFANMSPTRSPDPEWIQFDNSGLQPLSVPGVGLPINVTLKDRFQHGINDFHADRMTIREVAMLAFMDHITDKPDWNTKVFDESIVEKWRAESQSQPLMSSKTFEWCIAELQDKANGFAANGYVKTLENQSTCVKSDTIIGPSLRARLIQQCKPLQDAKDQDWHPKSKDEVLNLIHPSLFPLVYVSHLSKSELKAYAISECWLSRQLIRRAHLTDKLAIRVKVEFSEKAT